jgi:hypothetical protein
MFNFTEETLNQVAFFIDKPVTSTKFKPVVSRWNNRLHPFVLNGLDKGIAVLALVAQ